MNLSESLKNESEREKKISHSVKTPFRNDAANRLSLKFKDCSPETQNPAHP